MKIRQMLELNVQYQFVLQDVEAHEKRIRRAYFADLFLMMSNDERTQPPTAEEIVERRSEKMLAIGPVLEQLNQDLLDPLIDIVFDILLERDMLPVAPPELDGMPLKVEYVSIMAQAQKSMNVSALERFAGTMTKIEADAQDPSIGYRWNKSEWAQEYGDGLGMSPKVLRSDDEVQAMVMEAQKQQKAERAVAAASQVAQTTKDLSQSKLSEDNMLSRMMAQSRAGELAPSQSPIAA